MPIEDESNPLIRMKGISVPKKMPIPPVLGVFFFVIFSWPDGVFPPALSVIPNLAPNQMATGVKQAERAADEKKATM